MEEIENYALSTGPASASACRVNFGNSCGSGTVVSNDYNGGSLVLTNAHVSGSRIGTTGTCLFSVNGADRRVQARIIMAAYSDKTLADWSILFLPQFQIAPQVKLSKNRPASNIPYYTTGSPRCVWPLRNVDLRVTHISNNSALFRLLPNAIGGQSGSGIWSRQDNLQYGLLTWSWGGDTGAQMTSEIYRQAVQRTVAGEPRPEGLEELSERAEVENGFFAEVSIRDLPIWHDPTVVPPTVDPGKPCDVVNRELLIEFLREQSEFYGKWVKRLENGSEQQENGNGNTFGL
jgi:hypothetical protein